MSEPNLLYPILYILFAYCFGAIPTAYIVTKRLKGIDIREHGSGNVGATNVRRVVGPKAGLFVLIMDFIKGWLMVLGARWLFPELPWVAVLASLAAILGHSKSIWLGFSGGKSAITGLGTLFGMNPLGSLLVGLVAYGVTKLSRIVSLGTITAATLAPAVFYADYALLHHGNTAFCLYALMSATYVIVLHRSNIQRLIQGTENRLP